MNTVVPALALSGVSKHYGPVAALRAVDLTLARHSVLGLVGENGAGKSTLISIINGTVLPTDGELRVNGVAVTPGSPADAARAGIATVFQEQGLISNLRVFENMLLGREAGFSRRIVTLEVDVVDADASGFEPVWHEGRRVGFVTSGGYGYTTGKSVALALVDDDFAGEGTALSVHIVGVERPARVIAASPQDPLGKAMRQ